MSYEPTVWQCGDTITADKMNKIENGIAECCSGGGTDCGYSCEEGYIAVFDGSITTYLENNIAGYMFDSPLELGENVRVTFNGVEYDVEPDEENGYGASYDDDLGAFDFSEYPFYLASDYILTESVGTYTLKVENLEEVITLTDCFSKAARKANIFLINATTTMPSLNYDDGWNFKNQSVLGTVIDKTFNEIQQAISDGCLPILNLNYSGHYILPRAIDDSYIQFKETAHGYKIVGSKEIYETRGTLFTIDSNGVTTELTITAYQQQAGNAD